MPLIQGYSDAARSKNIATLRHEGKPAAQAAAIAYKIQRTEQRKAGKRATSRPKLTGGLSKRDARTMAKRGKKRSTALTVHRGHSPIIKTRRRGRTGGGSAPNDKGLLMICGSAFALGYIKSKVNIPTIAALGTEGTVAGVAYGLHKFGVVRSPILRDVAAGAGAVFFFDLGEKVAAGGGKTSGDETYDAAYRVP